LPAKLVTRMVVVVLKSGFVKEMEGKNGEERSIWRVAGSGYIPASRKNAYEPIAPDLTR
jgi:hypothetical protein